MITSIEDITSFVREQKRLLDHKQAKSLLVEAQCYILNGQTEIHTTACSFITVTG
jgi:hypothetical protein